MTLYTVHYIENNVHLITTSAQEFSCNGRYIYSHYAEKPETKDNHDGTTRKVRADCIKYKLSLESMHMEAVSPSSPVV